MAAVRDRELPAVAGLKLKQKSDHPRYHIPFSEEQIQCLLNTARVKEASTLPNVYIQKMPGTMPDTWLEGAEYLLRKAGPENMASCTEMTRIGALRHLLSEIGKHLEVSWTFQNKKAKALYTKREAQNIAKYANKILTIWGADKNGNLPDESRVLLSGQFAHLATRVGDAELNKLADIALVIHALRSKGLSSGAIGFLEIDRSTGRKRTPHLNPRDYLIRVETFYICQLWEHFLHREVATSVNPATGDAQGPLVRFMTTILTHWRPSKIPSATAVRERIRRYRDPMGRLARNKHLSTHLAPNH